MKFEFAKNKFSMLLLIVMTLSLMSCELETREVDYQSKESAPTINPNVEKHRKNSINKKPRVRMATNFGLKVYEI